MKYNVGTKVRVRQWMDMEREFGLNEYGHIQCKPCFQKWMRNRCGGFVTIASVNENTQTYKVEGLPYFEWSDEMFECPNVYLTDNSVIYAFRHIGDTIYSIIVNGDNFQKYSKRVHSVEITSNTIEFFDNEHYPICSYDMIGGWTNNFFASFSSLDMDREIEKLMGKRKVG